MKHNPKLTIIETVLSFKYNKPVQVVLEWFKCGSSGSRVVQEWFSQCLNQACGK